MSDKIKIAVLVKQVQGEINPFDACALEAALEIDNAEITVISLGRLDTQPLLTNLTRLGNIRAVLVSDMAFAGSDTLVTAKTLKKAIEYIYGADILPDLIFCGRQSVDGDTAQVPPCLSRMMDIPIITKAMGVISVCEDNISCTTRNGDESHQTPCIVTFERINTLRLPSIRSKPSEVQVITNNELGLDKQKCGILGSPTQVIKTFESVRGKRKCKFVGIDELDNIINDALSKANESIKPKTSEVKLPVVHCVGDEVKEIAKSIATEVKIIEKTEIDDIIEMIRRKNAQFVLWDSGEFGRKYAPMAAADLNTGLCADCTLLETDGEELYFYRPAMSGKIIAKIRCKTEPKMATVRTLQNSDNDIVISLGCGALCKKDEIIGFAKKHGFGLGASRGSVDKNEMPYEAQIGLTGKSISPKVYIAMGISGAVHHVCAIETAGTVIAINSDKNAPIFEYADYGIVADISEIF